MSAAEYGVSAVSSAPVRDAVLQRLSKSALVDSLASDADIVFQIALEKRKWSRVNAPERTAPQKAMGHRGTLSVLPVLLVR